MPLDLLAAAFELIAAGVGSMGEQGLMQLRRFVVAVVAAAGVKVEFEAAE